MLQCNVLKCNCINSIKEIVLKLTYFSKKIKKKSNRSIGIKLYKLQSHIKIYLSDIFPQDSLSANETVQNIPTTQNFITPFIKAI